MIKGTIDSYELWQSRPENLNENMEDPIKAAENRGWNQCNRRWIKTIEEQPKVDGKDTNVPSKWISCSEMLPELRKDCLVTVKYSGFMGMHGIWIKTGHMEKEGVWRGDCCGGEVIAWMPLPEPYKEETK